MLRVVGALVVMFNGAAASEWVCDTAADDKDLGIECMDIIDLFMQDVLDVPKESAGRRLLVVDGNDMKVTGDTPGQQFAFLFDLMVHGNYTASGWRLPPGRRLGHTKAGESLARWMDAMQGHNNKGVGDGKMGRENAIDHAWKKATRDMSDGMNNMHRAKDNNHKIINLANTKIPEKHWRYKFENFMTGPKVGGRIHKNNGILTHSYHTVHVYHVPIVSGLCLMASSLFSSIGMDDQRPLEEVAPVRTFSSPSQMKVFSFMAAGMITLSAAMVAASRQWSRWRASMDSEKAEKTVITDVE